MVVNAVVRTEPSKYWLQDESKTGSRLHDDGAEEVAEPVDEQSNCQLIFDRIAGTYMSASRQHCRAMKDQTEHLNTRRCTTKYTRGSSPCPSLPVRGHPPMTYPPLCSTYTSPTSTAHPTHIATTATSANCRPRTWMPFWHRIWYQSSPASDAENVSVNAPKFEPSASA